MRNRKFIYAALALLTLGFAACQQEEDFAPQGGEKELRIATRSTAAEGTTETFTRDFNLDLWSNENPDKYERHAMHHDGTSWNVVKTNKLYDKTVAFAITGKGMNMDTNADKINIFSLYMTSKRLPLTLMILMLCMPTTRMWIQKLHLIWSLNIFLPN